jgi:hypothetical protein
MTGSACNIDHCRGQLACEHNRDVPRTLTQCFNQTVENVLGRAVKDQVLQILRENETQVSEIGGRFDDVAKLINDVFGNSSRLLIYRTVVEMYEEYSIRPTFGFYDSLRDQLVFLREKVLADLMKPRHSASIDDSIYVANVGFTTNSSTSEFDRVS